MTRRQAIIWGDDDYFADAYMRHSASMTRSPFYLSVILSPLANAHRKFYIYFYISIVCVRTCKRKQVNLCFIG